MSLQVHSLHLYPVKSCRGIAVKSLSLNMAGAQGDREWMLVDEEGKFLSQRTVPAMAQVEVVLDESHLTLAFAGRFFKLSRSFQHKKTRRIQIWEDTFEAFDEPLLYSEALSQFLNKKCFLVKAIPQVERPLHWQDSITNQEVVEARESRFYDRAPVLITQLSSLAHLNQEIEKNTQAQGVASIAAVDMDAFRANIVISGGEAYAEDHWQRFRIGAIEFEKIKACARCVIINIDQSTGVSRSKEPLATLAKYRREQNKVLFGILARPLSPGPIAIGQNLEIL